MFILEHFTSMFIQENSATLTNKNILRCESEIFAWYRTLRSSGRASNTETIKQLQKFKTKL